MVYILRPVVLLICAMFVWVLMPLQEELTNVKYIILIIIICGAGSVYGHLCAGWRSNSNYAIIGRLRCIAQRLSYEVSLSFILIFIIIVATNISLRYFYRIQEYCPSII